MDALRENIKYTSELITAACAVIDLEYERVNAGGGEPYHPLSNPGYFDPRIVALAQLVDGATVSTVPEVVTPCPNPAGNPTSLRESVEMLDAVYGFLRAFKSTQIKNSRKWHAASQSCIEINNAVKLIDQIPAEQVVTPCHKPDLHLDVELDQARALHRVWRALNDGDCPKCHKAVAATDVIRPQNKDGVWIKCPNPSCGFLVMGKEIEEIERLFAPAMNAAVAIFESWREVRFARKGDAS